MATNIVNQSLIEISIATSPNNLEAVPGLLTDLKTGVSALSAGSREARHDMLIKARTLVQSLETPRETMLKHCWAQTGAMSGLIFGVDTGLWKLMAENGEKPQKVSDLATSLAVEPLLLRRIMRHLGAMGYITETGFDEYMPTNYSKAMSIPIISDGYIAMISGTSAGPIKFHEFARKRSFRNPTDAKDTGLMYAYNTDKDFFEWQRSLGYDQYFNHHMGGYRQGRPPWMAPGFYPVQERLIAGADTHSDAPFLVDIAGNLGHDLMEFHRYHPDAPGRLILQDLAVVISKIEDLSPAITPMAYDFYTEQPVKNARAYYMHTTLHDWPDEPCVRILSRVTEAMKPGYSRLLINENVMPPFGAHWETTAMDMQMLSLLSTMERTRADWYHLLEDLAGLKIVQIWSGGSGVESLIECELPYYDRD
ncbi:S-adenosyl-L-methionine-dependent methyltransferase [Fusarium oxysporum Fo47]|uniref:Catechol O-methyltransferase n=1 Tax=Fusarium oxysporum Fo47 TaxID=660027 RepID=W9JHC0_FUSOX|nr:S-adenosyl-L-methionine-dependent methyltransferase [Fusarium oxysporum Fo47]EWZ31442.1 catechol O-methyltransferase [Fusarium oxysporum Fo47]QKD59058.1 S-adenosyl-L-methionine-dependent methyltransferase [Fusarium oxysporum Fo47]